MPNQILKLKKIDVEYKLEKEIFETLIDSEILYNYKSNILDYKFTENIILKILEKDELKKEYKTELYFILRKEYNKIANKALKAVKSYKEHEKYLEKNQKIDASIVFNNLLNKEKNNEKIEDVIAFIIIILIIIIIILL